MLAGILLFISSVNIQYSLVTQYLKRVHLRTVSLPPYYSGLHKQIVGLSLKRELADFPPVSHSALMYADNL